MTESEVDALLDEVRVIRDTTDDPRARQAAELILQDAALSAAERAEVVSDIAREARDTLPRIALAAPGKSNEQVVSLATRTEEE